MNDSLIPAMIRAYYEINKPKAPLYLYMNPRAARVVTFLFRIDRKFPNRHRVPRKMKKHLLSGRLFVGGLVGHIPTETIE